MKPLSAREYDTEKMTESETEKKKETQEQHQKRIGQHARDKHRAGRFALQYVRKGFQQRVPFRIPHHVVVYLEVEHVDG